MALINCPGCGKQISDLANTCVHCGYQLKEPRQEAAADETAADFGEPAVAPAPSSAPAVPKKVLSPAEKKKRLIIIGAAAAVVVIAVVLIIVLGGKKDKEDFGPVTSSNLMEKAGFTTENTAEMNIFSKGASTVENLIKNPSEGNFFTKMGSMVLNSVTEGSK